MRHGRREEEDKKSYREDREKEVNCRWNSISCHYERVLLAQGADGRRSFSQALGEEAGLAEAR